MGLHEYNASKVIVGEGFPFYGIIMAAMFTADTTNFEKLAAAFPEAADEARARYNAPGGLLPGDPGYEDIPAWATGNSGPGYRT